MNVFKNLRTKRNNQVLKTSIIKGILRISMYTLIFTVVVTSIFTLFYLNNIAVEISEDKATASINSVEREIQVIEQYLEMYVDEITTNQNILGLTEMNNSASIQNYINSLKNDFTNASNFTITDTKGTVIASTNSKNLGQNTSGNLLNAALSGKTVTEIGRVASDYFGINVLSPIYINNVVSGVIIADYNLEDVVFLDNIKSLIGSEITIFEKDLRINTTIIQDGKRLIGTKLDSKIANTVVNNKENYIGKADILGIPYITVYKPILSYDGNVNGILFTGSDYTFVENSILKAISLITIISILSITASIFILINYFKKRLKSPLDKVVAAAISIETGEIDENIINQLNDITTNDEIGSLARSMEGAVKSVTLLTNHINEYKTAVISNDLTYTADSSAHRGIYLSIITIVDNLFSELRNILFEISQAAEQIDAGSEHVSSAAQILAQGATEQASSTEEMAATISDVSEQTKSNTLTSHEASNLSQEAENEVLKSSQYMNNMMNSMEEISSTSKEIEKIIKAIDDIAFQTNILALNAAVEAARAGVAGKGFAVVADEVRNLASKSADAAKSTTKLIESSTAAVQKGYQFARETEISLNNVVDKTNKTNLLINEIAVASQKQSDNIYQISIGIDQISSVVQANSATAEEIAASSEELTGQSQSLKAMVDKYKL